MRDYMKALCCRFEMTSRRAEYLDRKIERTHRQLTRLLDEPERKLLLKMADLEDALREEACLNSFISGYRLAQGIQQELLAISRRTTLRTRTNSGPVNWRERRADGWERNAPMARAASANGRMTGGRGSTRPPMTRDWEYAEPRLRENTKDYYLNYISNHIIPELGDIKLDKLTTIQIQKVYNDLQKNGRVQRYQHIQLKNKGLSVRVVHGIHTLLNSCLEQAVAEWLILVNPARGCKLPKMEKREMKGLPVSQQAVDLLVKEYKKHPGNPYMFP